MKTPKKAARPTITEEEILEVLKDYCYGSIGFAAEVIYAKIYPPIKEQNKGAR